MATSGEIGYKAHLNESSDMARGYFEDRELKYSDVGLEECKKLRFFINQICFKLLEDDSYSMVKDLEVNKKIKKDKYGTYLTMCGSYFVEREAVTFWNPKNNEDDLSISLCGWANGCNRIPVIKGFVKWCDWLDAKKCDANHGDGEK